jgi:hypothetical protein
LTITVSTSTMNKEFIKNLVDAMDVAIEAIKDKKYQSSVFYIKTHGYGLMEVTVRRV